MEKEKNSQINDGMSSKNKFSKRKNTKIKNNLQIDKNNNEIIKKDIDSNINKENNNQKIKKIRNPGVDIVRIIAMLFIIFWHFLFNGNGYRHFPQYKRQLTLMHVIFSWHDDGFMLLSGIVGYKTNKYSNLFYLWFCAFFYLVGIHKWIIYFKKNYNINQPM